MQCIFLTHNSETGCNSDLTYKMHSNILSFAISIKHLLPLLQNKDLKVIIT